MLPCNRLKLALFNKKIIYEARYNKTTVKINRLKNTQFIFKIITVINHRLSKLGSEESFHYYCITFLLACSWHSQN